jgi:hypothetical protein
MGEKRAEGDAISRWIRSSWVRSETDVVRRETDG